MLSSEWLSAEFAALIQVLLIDVTLAGDNAVIVGLAVNGLAPAQKQRAILIGIGLATLMRIVFSLVAVQLLAVVGLMLAGGFLLLYVSWKMFRELMQPAHHGDGAAPPPKTMRAAIMQIAIADVSMSLDNVLAVAGAARHHTEVLIIGLAVSVALMAAASTAIARLLERFRWIAWVGLAIVFYVALKMIWEGWHQVAPHVVG